MSKLLDEIRGLRDVVIGSDFATIENRGERTKTSRRRSLEQKDGSFHSWLKDTSAALEEICGMDIGILADSNWAEHYDNDLTPLEAAKLELDRAEELDEVDDDDDDFDELEGILEDVDEDDDFESVMEELAEFDILVSSKPRKSLRRKQDRLDNAKLYLQERTSVAREEPPVVAGGKTSMHDQILGMMSKAEIPEEVSEEVSGQKRYDPAMANQEMMQAAMGSIGKVIEKERSDKQSFLEQQKLKRIQDEDARETLKKSKGKDSVEEGASVMDGDHGRWGAATSAAGKTGAGLAKAISSATGEQYSFGSEGAARSDSVGSTLWFEFSPEKSASDIFFLGVNIQGDKEDPKWEVRLLRGKGLGSAKNVAREGNLKSDGISGAISRLKEKLPKKKEDKEE